MSLKNALVTLAAIGLWSGIAQAQSLDLSLSTEDEIAAQCGGEASAGQPIFAENCAACHSLEAVEDQPRGPHLFNLYGRAPGSAEGYDYRSDLPSRTEIWEGETLRPFLKGDPALPRHPTLPTEQARRDVLTYIRVHTRPAPPAPEEVEVPEAVLAMKGDVAYGEYLASGCLGCHNDAASQKAAMESIFGRDKAEFLALMYQYKARAIGTETMQLYATNVSDEEMAALAAYFEESDG